MFLSEAFNFFVPGADLPPSSTIGNEPAVHPSLDAFK